MICATVPCMLTIHAWHAQTQSCMLQRASTSAKRGHHPAAAAAAAWINNCRSAFLCALQDAQHLSSHGAHPATLLHTAPKQHTSIIVMMNACYHVVGRQLHNSSTSLRPSLQHGLGRCSHRGMTGVMNHNCSYSLLILCHLQLGVLLLCY